MDRRARLLGPTDRSHLILEIGPGHAPVAPKADGWNTHVVDHTTREALRQKYARASVDVGVIEAVDTIWTDGALHDAVPAALHGRFDTLIASHVVQHVPDLAGFLLSAQGLLRPGGRVALAVPDRRYCFDYFKPLSTTGDVLEARAARRTRHTRRTCWNHMAYSVVVGRALGWGPHPASAPTFIDPFASAMAAHALFREDADVPHVDYHAWHFTPASFALIILELGQLGVIDWRIDDLHGPEGFEFFVSLRRGAERIADPAALQARRMALLHQTLREIGEQVRFARQGASGATPGAPPENGGPPRPSASGAVAVLATSAMALGRGLVGLVHRARQRPGPPSPPAEMRASGPRPTGSATGALVQVTGPAAEPAASAPVTTSHPDPGPPPPPGQDHPGPGGAPAQSSRISAGASPESYQGFVEELSPLHVAGWVRRLSAPAERVPYQVVLPPTGEVLAQGVADQFSHGLRELGDADGFHGFHARLARPLAEAERAHVVVRPLTPGPVLTASPWLETAFQPLGAVAMDIVDNCNLRCPFCLYDYSSTTTTHLMTEETIDAALRLVPYTTDGGFWFSCLHEPTLHPKLVPFVEKVPRPYRRKLFYTTNLARPMAPSYFEWLAHSALHHVNISIESRDPALYERMRKGARHRVFTGNWDALMAHLEGSPTPPEIRYITMAYRSNLRELPDLVRYLFTERRAARVELRHTFDEPHIPPAFRAAEYLDEAGWAWLRDQLAGYSPEQVTLLLPPGFGRSPASPDGTPAPPAGSVAGTGGNPAPATSAAAYLRGRYACRLSWDGTLSVARLAASIPGDPPPEARLLTTNVRDIADVDPFLATLPE